MSLIISPVTHADIKALVDIKLKAEELSLYQHLLYNKGRGLSVPENETEAGLIELGIMHDLSNPFVRIWKAAILEERNSKVTHLLPPKKSEKLVGYASFRYHEGATVKEWRSPDYTPPEMNAELLDVMGREMTRLRQKYMNGKRHIVWGDLSVLPSYRHQGIESALLQWGFSNFALAQETIWSAALLDTRGILLAHGWKDEEVMELDLSRWGGEGNGYGVLRTQVMVSRPGELKVQVEEGGQK